MSNTTAHQYNFELETILFQFLSLIDGAVVLRYDVNQETKERVFVESVKPWYAFGPKHRIIHALTNKAKNFSYPFVTIKITGIEGNTDRIAAKHLKIDRYNGTQFLGYDRPTPITISVEVTISADKITDLYQIYSKLCTQFQPYCTFSWYVPHKNLDKIDWEELTGKAEWDFNVSFDVKDQLQESDREEYVGKMNFKITGWMFPNAKQCQDGIIYDIGTSNILSSDLANRTTGLDNMIKPLVSDIREDGNLESYNNPREWNNGHPRIVNVFQTTKIGNKYINLLLDKDRVHPFKLDEQKFITLDGYNFSRASVLFVPKEPIGIKTTLEKEYFDYGNGSIFPMRDTMGKKKSCIEGYKMNITERTPNKLTVNFNGIEYHGNFDIIVADAVDYDSITDRLKTAFRAR